MKTFATFVFLGLLVNAVLITPLPALALSNSGITYQGRIMKPDDTPVSGVHTKFRMKILTTGSDSCVMYQEEQEQDLSDSQGNFSLTLNDGNGVRHDIPTYDIEQIFANKGTFTFNVANCPTADVTYTPSADDHRILVVEFKDETMGSWEPMPPQTINYVPMALQAKNIAGFGIGNLVRVQEADGSFLSNVTPLSNANYDALKLLVAGTSGLYEKPGKLGGITVPSMGAVPGKVLGWDGSAWTVADPIAGVQAFAKTALPACAGGAYLRNNAGALECTTPAVGTTGTVTEIRTGTGLTGGPINDDGDIALATLNAGGTGFKVTYDVYGRVTAAVALVEADIPQLSTAGKVVGSAITSGQIGGTTSMDTTGLIKSTSGSFTALGTQGIQVFKTDNSYSVSIIANPAQGSDYTLTLPVNGGANGQVLTTNGTGGLSWTNAASGSVTSLTGDVTSTGSGAVATTIAANAVTTGKISDANVTFAKIQNVPTASLLGRYSSGSGAPESLTLGTGLALSGAGVLSSNITDTDTFAAVTTACGDGTVPLKAGGVWTCSTPTPLATSSAIVQRDGTGNFAANVITANGFAINNAGSAVTLTNLAGSAYTLTMPVGLGTNGQVLGTSGSGQLVWSTPAAPGTGDFKADGTVPMTGNIRLNGNYLSGDGGSEGVFVASDGSVGIGTTTPSTNLSFGAGAPRIISVERAASGVAGDYLALRAGSAGTASTDKGGGDVYLTAGNSAGAANSSIFFQTAAATAPGTGFNAAATRVTIVGSGSVGIGTTGPLTKLDVVGSLKVGDGGETCAAGINGAIRFNGGNLQYCVGTAWTTLDAAGAGLTALTGDVTASGGGSQAATIAANAVTTGKILDGTIATVDLADDNVTFAKIQNVPSATIAGRYTTGTGDLESLTLGTGLALSAGGVISSNITDTDTFAAVTTACADGTVPLKAGGVWTCSTPTPLATASAIVQRDGTGNFAANVITANGFAINNAGSAVTLTNLAGSAYTLTMPVGLGTNGQVLGTSGSGQLTWTTPAAAGTGDFKADGTIPMTGNIRLNGNWLSGDGGNEGIQVAADGKVAIAGAPSLFNFRVHGTTGFSGAVNIDNGGAIGIVQNNTTAYSPTGATAAPNSATSGYNAYNNAPADGATSLVSLAVKNTDTRYQSAYIGAVAAPGTTTYTPDIVIGATTGSASYAERMRIASSGSVGIGTSTPTGALDVKGVVKISGSTSGAVGLQVPAVAGSTVYTLPTTPTNGYVLSTDAAGVMSWIAAGGGGNFKSDGTVPMTGVLEVADGTVTAPGIAFAADTNVGFYRNTTNQLSVSAGGTRSATFEAANVGFPTKITVGTGSGAIVNSAFSATVPAFSFETDTNLGISRPATNTLSIITAGTEKLRVSGAGDVGIGTTATANGKLDVKGSIVMSGATSGFSGFQVPAVAGSLVYTLPAAAPTNGYVLSSTSAGVMSWVAQASGGGLPAASGTLAAPGISFSGDLNTGFYSSAADEISVSVGGMYSSTFQSNGDLVVAGNIQSLQHIEADGEVNSATSVSAPVIIAGGGSAPAPSFVTTNGSNTGMWSPGASILAWSTAGVERMRIGTTGNVGIGTTTTANGKLDVKGSIVMSGATSGYNGFRVPATAGSTIWQLPAADGTSGQVLSTDGAGILSWATASAGAASSVLASAGTAAAPSISFAADTNTGLYNVGADGIGFTTGGTNRLSIGTTNSTFYNSVVIPAGSLNVTGGISSDTFVSAIGNMAAGFGTAAAPAFTFASDPDNGMWHPATNTLAFSTAGVEAARFDASGNMGVGTTPASTAKLDVNGAIKSALISVPTPASGFDWSKGNIQYTSASCTGTTWNFTNIAPGASYTLAVQGNSHTGTCAFSDGASTFKYQPANAMPSAAKDVVYSFTKIGSVVYVTWIDAW